MTRITNIAGRTFGGARSIFNALIAMSFSCIIIICSATVEAPRATDEPIETQLQRLIEEQTSQLQGRIEVEVGQLDPRLKLATCARTEAYLPSGARLWGKSQVGLRCVSGAFWSVFIPVHVRVFGPALVSTRSIQAGQSLRPDDVRALEQELSKEPGRPVLDLATLESKTLIRSIPIGVVVREDWLRAIPIIQSGDQVRVQATGRGFSITVEGFALNSAAEGQQVKVRAESGRVVTGIARSGRIAEVRL
jgi:flagella basal body P-ring formation protein FlgA